MTRSTDTQCCILDAMALGLLEEHHAFKRCFVHNTRRWDVLAWSYQWPSDQWANWLFEIAYGLCLLQLDMDADRSSGFRNFC
jgi:hypothetical protein